MTCRHCGGRPLIQASLRKGKKRVGGLVHSDLINLPRPCRVVLNGESGWEIETFYIAHTFWEKELELHERWRLEQILDAKQEKDLDHGEVKDLVLKAVGAGCKKLPDVIEWIGILAGQQAIRTAVWSLIDSGRLYPDVNWELKDWELEEANNDKKSE